MLINFEHIMDAVSNVLASNKSHKILTILNYRKMPQDRYEEALAMLACMGDVAEFIICDVAVGNFEAPLTYRLSAKDLVTVLDVLSVISCEDCYDAKSTDDWYTATRESGFEDCPNVDNGLVSTVELMTMQFARTNKHAQAYLEAQKKLNTKPKDSGGNIPWN